MKAPRQAPPLRRLVLGGLWFAALVAWADRAEPHFLVLLPSADVVSPEQSRSIDLQVLFTHPMQQGPVMEMPNPERFGMLVGGKQHDLIRSLRPMKVQGKTAYTATVRLAQPGDHVFFIQPAPYWEPVEEKLIVQYAKVVVNFGGVEKGWDAAVGLPVEIEPLVRPYGLWTGNTFRGLVRSQGKPVPFARVEVEYYNQGGKVKPPHDSFITQVIKADAGGVFSYSIPRAGWWGFAALLDGPKTKGPTGKLVDVELGAVIWVRTVDMD